MPAWVIPAITAAAGLIGQGIAKGKDKRQLAQQGKLQELQIQGNKEMMDYGMALQKQMWEYTGYEGQMRQMKDAGINPGLMYGMGGGGGQTIGNASGNVTGGKSPSGSGREAEEMTSMGLALSSQIGLMEAQKKNIEADTANKLQDAEKKVVERENIGMQTGKAAVEIEKLTKETELITKTLADQIQKIKGESESAWTKGKVDTTTVNEQIDQKVKEAIQVSLKNANISQDTAQKVAEIAQKWKALDLEERKTAVLELTGGTQKDQDQIINIINTIVHIITRGKL